MPYAANTMGFPALPTGDVPVEVEFEEDLACHSYSMPSMGAAVIAYPAPVISDVVAYPAPMVSDDGTFCYPFNVNVRNTFVDCAPRITSFDEFFQERQVRSCPASCVQEADGNVKKEAPSRHGEKDIEALPPSSRTTAAGSSSAASSVGDDFILSSRDVEEQSISSGRTSNDARRVTSKKLHFEAPGGGYASMDENISTPDLQAATAVYAVPPPPFAGEPCTQVMAQQYPGIEYASNPCYPMPSQCYTAPSGCYNADATQAPVGQYPAHDVAYYGAQGGSFQMQNSGPAYTQHVFNEFRLQGGTTEYTCLNHQHISSSNVSVQHQAYACTTGQPDTSGSCYAAPVHTAPQPQPYAQAYAGATPGPSFPRKKPDFGLDEPQHFAITQVVDLAPEAVEGGAMRRVLSLSTAINSACSDKREAPSPAVTETPEVTPEADAPTGPLPSLGSAGHEAGRCKPCAFQHTKGCGNGLDCPFCHLCEPGEKKKRRKEKLETRRTMRQLRQALSSGFGFGGSTTPA
mmetsp:Transcript_3761/g.6196  ORF Transcript_3761/g.6196 Transcript_3761/m.6196 type:complete len:517 (+) Transcript_3761:70-1620(+)